ncbi:MAG: hypothetical protein ABID87_02590 [Chloroflexota bacterium]
MMAELEVFSPVAKVVTAKTELAPRINDLKGKVIGLYRNSKKGGDVALERVAELLSQRYPGVQFRSYRGSQGLLDAVSAEDADRIVRETDAVIAAIGD